MQLRITHPMTAIPILPIIEFMPKPGRRLATPADFKEALAQRIKFARENQGYEIPEMARLLSRHMGRKIEPDTYRKWETVNSSIPHDAILPFCDLTKTHPFQLLAKPSDDELALLANGRKSVTAA